MRSGGRALRLVRRAVDALAAGLLLAVLVVTSAQVAARYAFGVAMPWGSELTRLLFVWLIFIAASRAPHMAIDILPSALPRRSARALRLGSAIFGALLLTFIIRHSLTLIELTAYDRYTALGLSVQYLYWAAVVGGGLWIALSLAEAALSWSAERAE